MPELSPATSPYLVRARCNYALLRASCRQDSRSTIPAIGAKTHPALASGTGLGSLPGLLSLPVVVANARAGRIKVAVINAQVLRIRSLPVGTNILNSNLTGSCDTMQNPNLPVIINPITAQFFAVIRKEFTVRPVASSISRSRLKAAGLHRLR
jgi:hypothetical protein